MGSFFNSLNPSDIGLPASVGFAVGVRNVMTEHNAFSANLALCHLKHLPEASVYINFLIYQDNV